MTDRSRLFEDSSPRAELSGVLLESVEEILREPIEETDFARALDRARQLAHVTTPDRSQPRRRLSPNHTLERIQSMIRTHKRLTVAAVAALAALAAGLIVYVAVVSSPASAYALEQTAEANDHITSCHVRITPAPRDSISEAWAQFSAGGVAIRVRADLPNTGEGPYVVLISGERCDVWFKAKNSHLVMHIDDFVTRFTNNRDFCDPKRAFEKLLADEKAGKVQVATHEPAEAGQPVMLTVTAKDSPDSRDAYEVNPVTKLVERVVHYCRRGDKWERESQREYLDYNKEIDPAVFKLDTPKDIVTIDQFNQEVGLPKGRLSDNEIACKVVRAYFEAMIAGDYAKASKMYSGFPVEKLAAEKDWCHYTRIISVGAPKSDAKYGRVIRVPIRVEWEVTKPIPPRIVFTSPTVRIADTEKATKAVRRFYEALIAQDYNKATRISQEVGMVDENFLPAEEIENLKKAFEENSVKVSRIIEIGKPAPHPESGCTEVPIRVELRVSTKMGKDSKEFSPMVSPVMRQPGRWGICGGI